MTNDEKIRDEKLQNNINREAAKISALTEKLQKYQHYHQARSINMNFLQAKKLYIQSRITIQAQFTY